MSGQYEPTAVQQARFDEWKRWDDRKSDLTRPLTDDEHERLMLELRDLRAPHQTEMVMTYDWVADCPHTIDENLLEAVLLEGADRYDAVHPFDEEGELFCLESPAELRCFCGDGHCDRESNNSTEREDFWWDYATATGFGRAES